MRRDCWSSGSLSNVGTDEVLAADHLPSAPGAHGTVAAGLGPRWGPEPLRPGWAPARRSGTAERLRRTCNRSSVALTPRSWYETRTVVSGGWRRVAEECRRGRRWTVLGNTQPAPVQAWAPSARTSAEAKIAVSARSRWVASVHRAGERPDDLDGAGWARPFLIARRYLRQPANTRLVGPMNAMRRCPCSTR